MRVWSFSSQTELPRSGTTSVAFVACVQGFIVFVQSLLEVILAGQGAELDHDRVEFLAAGLVGFDESNARNSGRPVS
jgi:hypothetical protein